MKDGAFLDISKLTKEDFDNIKIIMKESDCDFKSVLWYYQKKYPNKVRIVGKIKDDVILRDEITSKGVSEYEGKEALKRIAKDMRKP